MSLSHRALGLFAPLSLLLVTLGACSSSQPGAAEDVSTAKQDLYGLGSIGTKWPGGNVPVCFQDTTNRPDLQALLKTTLLNGWGAAANINFTGFGACAASGPQATVIFGTTLNSAGQPVDGTTQGSGVGNTMTTLNPGMTTARFSAVALHEFGHVLGFAHEMARPDNWDGGVELQCAGTTPDFQEITGGIPLTANFDPDSIMNYCADGNGAPSLSVGDILGVSASAYGPELGCVFASRATVCNETIGLHAEETFTVPTLCPTPWDSWVLQVNNGGTWTNVPNSCPNGAQAGTCGTNTNPNSFTLGYQAEGAANGPAIGSVQTVRMCGANNNCTPAFDLTITDCQTTADQLYLNPNNNPLQVSQGGDAQAYVLMYGPWVQADQGVNAWAQWTSNPIPGSTITFSPGTDIDGSGAINMYVSVPYTTMAKTYYVPVVATDVASQVTRSTIVPVEVLTCNTTPPSQVCTSGRCGNWSIGCGQTTPCGGCSGSDSCSFGVCCPPGYTGNGEGCVSNTPPTCKSPMVYCAASGTCMTALGCQRLNGGP